MTLIKIIYVLACLAAVGTLFVISGDNFGLWSPVLISSPKPGAGFVSLGTCIGMGVYTYFVIRLK